MTGAPRRPARLGRRRSPVARLRPRYPQSPQAAGCRYLTLNLAGSAGLAASGAAHAAWPSAVLNLLWLTLGLTAFARRRHGTPDRDTDLFRDQRASHVLLARDSDKVVGLATYSFLWPAAGLTTTLYLKELYVTSSYRRHGVGRLLIEQLRRIAHESGCSRVEWTTDHDNPGAQQFYQSLGFAPHPAKIFYRIEVN